MAIKADPSPGRRRRKDPPGGRVAVRARGLGAAPARYSPPSSSAGYASAHGSRVHSVSARSGRQLRRPVVNGESPACQPRYRARPARSVADLRAPPRRQPPGLMPRPRPLAAAAVLRRDSAVVLGDLRSGLRAVGGGEPLGQQEPGFSSYSWVPTVSSACTAIMLPSWAARSSGSPQAIAGQEAGPDASPAPVGSCGLTPGHRAPR